MGGGVGVREVGVGVEVRVDARGEWPSFFMPLTTPYRCTCDSSCDGLPTHSLRTPYGLPTYSLRTPHVLPTCARLTGVPQAVFIMSLPETTRASPKSATLMVRVRVRVNPLTLTLTLAPNP